MFWWHDRLLNSLLCGGALLPGGPAGQHIYGCSQLALSAANCWNLHRRCLWRKCFCSVWDLFWPPWAEMSSRDVLSRRIPPTGFIWRQSEMRTETELEYSLHLHLFQGKNVLLKILVRGKSSLNEPSSRNGGQCTFSVCVLCPRWMGEVALPAQPSITGGWLRGQPSVEKISTLSRLFCSVSHLPRAHERAFASCLHL